MRGKRTPKRVRSATPRVQLVLAFVGVLVVFQALLVLATFALVPSPPAKTAEILANSRSNKFVSVAPRQMPEVSFKLLQRAALETRKPPDDTKVLRHVGEWWQDFYFEQFSRKRQVMFSAARVEEEKTIWKKFYAQLRTMSAPPEMFRARQGTRGIVMSCGGSYFSLCVANLKILIELHRVALPVEVWYNRGELRADQEQELVAVRNRWGSLRIRLFDDVVPAYQLWLGETMQAPVNIGVKQFHFKLMALVGSAFSEALWLDSDVTAARNPIYLWEEPAFRATGALFFPDMYSLSERSLAWRAIDKVPQPMWAMESGQVLIDKTRCWRELFLAALFNQRQEFWYSCVNGDKDTFLMAWIATGQPFTMIPFPPSFAGTGNSPSSFCGNSFVQSDLQGRPLFVHAVGAKDILKRSQSQARRWESIKTYDPTRATPIYRWSRACIDAETKVAKEVTTPPAQTVEKFNKVLGNIEDAIFFFAHNKEAN